MLKFSIEGTSTDLNISELAHSMSIYQRCLGLPLEDLNGKYLQAFKKCKQELAFFGKVIVETALPNKVYAKQSEQKAFDKLKLFKEQLLYASMYGYNDLSEVSPEKLDEEAVKPFLKLLQESVAELTKWEPEKPKASSSYKAHSMPLGKIAEVSPLVKGDLVITKEAEFVVEQETTLEEKGSIAVGEQTIKASEIWCIDRAGKTVFRRFDPAAEDAYNKRHEDKNEVAEKVAS